MTQKHRHLIVREAGSAYLRFVTRVEKQDGRKESLVDGVAATPTQKADEISRGDLAEPVSLRSNDELDDLSAALERMRVSMSGALERLRRRR